MPKIIQPSPSTIRNQNVSLRKEAQEIIDLIGYKPSRFWEVLIELAGEKLPPKPSLPLNPPPLPPHKSKRRDVLTPEYAYELCDEIESLAEDVPERAEVFAESVCETAASIRETIEQRESVTEKQINALENIRDGLRKWVDNRRDDD